MKIEKVINNNIVSSFDEKGREVVVMGRGLGFGRRAGDVIADDKIEKIFRMETSEESARLQSVLAEIPIENIQLTNEIIAYANKEIDKKLNKNIYITLTDHINFAIERYKQGLNFSNALLWEIKRFYSKEFEVGRKALDIIRDRVNIELPEDEAAAIAMHLVNAELGTDMPDTVDMTKLVQNVLKIVRYHYGIELNEDTLDYERFITHLKFFAQRIIMNKPHCDNDIEFNNMVRRQYKDAYRCAEKVKEYVLKEFNTQVSDEELVYLAVHIKRITVI